MRKEPLYLIYVITATEERPQFLRGAHGEGGGVAGVGGDEGDGRGEGE